jgi:hypothetical protein
MYPSLITVASFWSTLTDIDRQLQQDVIAKGCPLCGGPLHVANHPRKPRGVPSDAGEAWEQRFNTCCGWCRRRCMPPSVRFLGRRVYAGVIVMLATMVAVVCEAADKTLGRWLAWWTQVLPTLSYWTVLRAGFVPAVQSARLPASLVERYEPAIGEQTPKGLINTLRALAPITTSTATRTQCKGRPATAGLAHKMAIDCNRRGLLRRAQAPPKPT